MQNLYRRRFPKRTRHQRMIDVLRMSPNQFTQFRGAAKHMLGDKVLHEDIQFPSNKVKPSSLRTIANTQHPRVLASMMQMEHAAHNDATKDWHEGGGLGETATSLFSGLWSLIGLGPEFQDWFNFFDYESPENHISESDEDYARIIQQSYRGEDDRDATLDDNPDWVLDRSLDNEKFSVWVDEPASEVHVALRGTKAELSDLGADMNIIWNNQSGSVEEIQDFLEQVENKYDGYTLDASGHSLGGNQLIEAFTTADSDKLQGYSRVNVFSPGTNPMWSLDDSKEAVEDDRFYFYLNSGDLLSNTFVSLIPSERDNVYWSRPTHNPLTNHGVAQWTSDI